MKPEKSPPYRYKNPWYTPGAFQDPEWFETTVKPIEYGGYLIFNRIEGTGVPGSAVFDVVKDNICVSQLAGLKGAYNAIDRMNAGFTDLGEKVKKPPEKEIEVSVEFRSDNLEVCRIQASDKYHLVAHRQTKSLLCGPPEVKTSEILAYFEPGERGGYNMVTAGMGFFEDEGAFDLAKLAVKTLNALYPVKQREMKD